VSTFRSQRPFRSLRVPSLCDRPGGYLSTLRPRQERAQPDQVVGCGRESHDPGGDQGFLESLQRIDGSAQRRRLLQVPAFRVRKRRQFGVAEVRQGSQPRSKPVWPEPASSSRPRWCPQRRRAHSCRVLPSACSPRRVRDASIDQRLGDRALPGDLVLRLEIGIADGPVVGGGGGASIRAVKRTVV